MPKSNLQISVVLTLFLVSVCAVKPRPMISTVTLQSLQNMKHEQHFVELQQQQQQTRTPRTTIPPNRSVAAINGTELVENNADRCPRDFSQMVVDYCRQFALAMMFRYGGVVLYQARWSAENVCRKHTSYCEVRHPTVGTSTELEIFDFSGICVSGKVEKYADFEYSYSWATIPGQRMDASGSHRLYESVPTTVITLRDKTGALAYQSNFTIAFSESTLGLYLSIHVDDSDGSGNIPKIHISNDQLLTACKVAATVAPPVNKAPVSPASSSTDNTTPIIVGVVVGVGVLLVVLVVIVAYKKLRARKAQLGFEEMRDQEQSIVRPPPQPVMGVVVAQANRHSSRQPQQPVPIQPQTLTAPPPAQPQQATVPQPTPAQSGSHDVVEPTPKPTA